MDERRWHSFFCLKNAGEKVSELVKTIREVEGVLGAYLYRTEGFRVEVDRVVWCVFSNEMLIPEVARIFTQEKVQIVWNFWGYTQPSQYTGREGITSRIPGPRKKYLVVYPFVKTHEWYQLPYDERAEMMREHVKVGSKYKDIDQVLLYATGLADWEFVVAYETDDLVRFSQLVAELRSTKARPFTQKDTPIITGAFVDV